MKTLLNCLLLLVSLISFQSSAHAGLLSSFLKLFGKATVDFVTMSKPVARSATRLIDDGDHDHKKGNHLSDNPDDPDDPDDPYEYFLKRQQNVLNQMSLMGQPRPAVPIKTRSTESENTARL